MSAYNMNGVNRTERSGEKKRRRKHSSKQTSIRSFWV